MVVDCLDPYVTDSLLRMRKLLDVQRGDWQALVRHVRDTTKLKTGVLARMASVSPETWWRWEHKGQKPKEAEVVHRFAEAFSLEVDDAMWAAGLLIEGQAVEADPRLLGLDPNDRVVKRIMALWEAGRLSDALRERALLRRRRILAEREEQDLEDLELLTEAEQDRERSQSRGVA